MTTVSSKSTVAILCDIHFDIRNGSAFFSGKYKEFFDKVFFPTLKERGIKTLWILGDTWEYRTKINSVSLNFAIKNFFDRLEEDEIDTTIIYGNHDVAYRADNSINTIDFLGKMYPNLRVVKDFATLTVHGQPINFMPWIHAKNFGAAMEFMAAAPPTVLCGHYEINGFETTKGQYAHGGLEPNIFSKFDKVFSGHFHIRSNQGPIHYLGNPFQTNWGDYGYERGFHFFDVETHELEFVSNPFDIYAKIDYNDDIDIGTFSYSAFTNMIVRVYIPSYATTNQNKLSLFLDKLQQAAYSTEVVEREAVAVLSETGEIEFLDNKELIDKYINEVVDAPNIDKTVLLGMFNELYVDAQNMVERE